MDKKLLLIQHQTNNIEILNESVDGSKQLKIEGIFAQAEIVNENKRFYKREILEESLDTYIKEYINKNKALGEMDHPDYPLPNKRKAVIRIEELKWDGNNVYGKAIVLDTPEGNILRGLLEGGVQMGVSTRALGSLTERNNIKYVDKGLITTAIDVVDDPSGPNCFVDSILESIYESVWRFDNGVYIKEDKNIITDENLAFQLIEDFIKKIK